MKKVGIIAFIVLFITLIGGIAYNVYAKYVLSKRVSLSFDTSDYYFNVEVDKKEITSLPATINVTVRNYEGNNFTDNDLKYILAVSNANLDFQISEKAGTLQGGSKQEKSFIVTMDMKNGVDGVKEDVNLKINVEKPYIDTKEVHIDVDYRSENITVRLADGMIPVKYVEGTGWVKTTASDREWYNYREKNWANVVLKDSTFNGDVLDETKAYTQLVWIPRFAYKITSQYHTEKEGNIEVACIDTNNQNRNKTKKYGTVYPKATTGGGMEDFVLHPAFEYGGKSLDGFWVGKFESSHTNCTKDVTTGETNYSGNEIMTVRANVTSWRNIEIEDAFNNCLNMNRKENPYGLSARDSIVDPHLTKNDEWGAIAYLSKSVYGKQTEQVFGNNSSDYITGNSGDSADASEAAGIQHAYDTKEGMEASTTGNITGVYDMSGGNWEYVAAYIDNGSDSFIQYGGALVKGEERYKNVYQSTVKDGSDAEIADYALAIPANGHYGDAIYETTKDVSNISLSWYRDCSIYPFEIPFFVRGGAYKFTFFNGVFAFGRGSGGNEKQYGFRVVVPVL